MAGLQRVIAHVIRKLL